MYKLILLAAIVVLSVSNVTGYQSNPDWDCGEICNEVCFTFYMEECTYTWCQLDDDDPGQTWMCLGESKYPRPGGNE